ncbi:hypothetical protein [Tsukamurella ocularis]|uniref:hypothetical protein n=1 Tax=Tsukamurella ocularis TaxID=1970234 RepID=UPI0039EFB8B0
MSTMLILCIAVLALVVAAIITWLALVAIRQERRRQAAARRQRVLIRREQHRAEQKLRAMTHFALAEMLRVAREDQSHRSTESRNRHGGS